MCTYSTVYNILPCCICICIMFIYGLWPEIKLYYYYYEFIIYNAIESAAIVITQARDPPPRSHPWRLYFATERAHLTTAAPSGVFTPHHYLFNYGISNGHDSIHDDLEQRPKWAPECNNDRLESTPQLERLTDSACSYYPIMTCFIRQRATHQVL